jgi:hypothetical protein
MASRITRPPNLTGATAVSRAVVGLSLGYDTEGMRWTWSVFQAATCVSGVASASCRDSVEEMVYRESKQVPLLRPRPRLALCKASRSVAVVMYIDDRGEYARTRRLEHVQCQRPVSTDGMQAVCLRSQRDESSCNALRTHWRACRTTLATARPLPSAVAVDLEPVSVTVPILAEDTGDWEGREGQSPPYGVELDASERSRVM